MWLEIDTRERGVSGVTAHCPHCGEPVTLVSISTLVTREVQACGCGVDPEPVGPSDGDILPPVPHMLVNSAHRG